VLRGVVCVVYREHTSCRVPVEYHNTGLKSWLHALVICIPSEPHTFTPVEQVMFTDVQMRVKSCCRE